MSNRKKIGTIGLLTILTILLICQNSAIARSVYAVPQHWGTPTILNVYDILEGGVEGQLEYRATYNLKFGGACDVTIDTQSNILFVTFEGEYYIELINARTFLDKIY